MQALNRPIVSEIQPTTFPVHCLSQNLSLQTTSTESNLTKPYKHTRTLAKAKAKQTLELSNRKILAQIFSRFQI